LYATKGEGQNCRPMQAHKPTHRPRKSRLAVPPHSSAEGQPADQVAQLLGQHLVRHTCSSQHVDRQACWSAPKQASMLYIDNGPLQFDANQLDWEPFQSALPCTLGRHRCGNTARDTKA